LPSAIVSPLGVSYISVLIVALNSILMLVIKRFRPNEKNFRKRPWKVAVMNSFNLIQALLSLAFLITLCLYRFVFDNFDARKFVCIKCECVCK
jgi:hypothetical protein